MATITRTINGFTTTLTITENSRNIDNNTTTIKYSLTTVDNATNDPWGYAPYDVAINIKINGDTVYNGSQSFDFRKYNTKTWASGSKVIKHNSDGTKSISAYFSLSTAHSSFPNSANSGTVTLTTIPRATTPITDSNSYTIGYPVKVTLNRASTSFNHDIYYKLGTMTSWEKATSTRIGTSFEFTIPRSYSKYLPNSTQGTIRISAVTYSGSTRIGEKIVDKDVYVGSGVAPTANLTITGIDRFGTTYLQGRSRVKVSASGTGTDGSTIKSVSTTIKKGSSIIQSSSSKSFTSKVLEASGTYTVTTKVIDSRGRSGSTSRTFSVTKYSPPTFKGTAYRSNSSGYVDDSGGYITIEGSVIYTALTNNSTKAEMYYKKVDTSTWYNINTGTTSKSIFETVTASTESEYDVMVAVSDTASGDGGKAVYRFVVSSSEVLIDFYKTGKGIAIGKVSDKDYVIELSDEFSIYGGSAIDLDNSRYSNFIPSGTNLNNLNTQGIFLQASDQRAESGRNYPVNKAGILEVFSRADNRTVIQRYTTFNGQEVWTRAYYAEAIGVSGKWYPWTSPTKTYTYVNEYVSWNDGKNMTSNVTIKKNNNVVTVQFYVNPPNLGYTKLFSITSPDLRPTTITAGAAATSARTDDHGLVYPYISGNGTVYVVTKGSSPKNNMYITFTYVV